MKTTVKKGSQQKDGQRRTSTREKKSRLLSEHAFVIAAPAPAILGGDVDTMVREDARVEDAHVTEAGVAVSAEAEPVVEPAGTEPVTVTKPEVGVEPVAPVIRPGVVEGPLAKRMHEKAAQRQAGKKTGKGTRASHRGLGPEFDQTDATVKSLKAKLVEARGAVNGKLDPALIARIAELRAQLVAQRGTKVEGLEPFDDDIAAARQQLQKAREAKRAFLAEQGISVPVAPDGQPSIRQQLRALRTQLRAATDEAGGAKLAELRKAYRQAKVARKAACETAIAARTDQAKQSEVTAEGDAQPITDQLPTDALATNEPAATAEIAG
jgi:hypothetical protein